MTKSDTSHDAVAPRGKLPIAELIACSVLVVIIAAILFPVFAKAKVSTGKNICAMNLLDMVRDLKLYASDFDDRLPNANAWMDAIQPRELTDKFLHDVIGIKPGEYGYAFRDKASGISIPEVEDPKLFILVFDSTLIGKNAHGDASTLPRPGRHHGADYIMSLDDHLKRFPAPELAR